MNAPLGIARDVRATRAAARGKVREDPAERKTFSFSVCVSNDRAGVRARAIATRPAHWKLCRRTLRGTHQAFSRREGRLGAAERGRRPRAETAAARYARWWAGGTDVGPVKAKERERQRKKRVDTITVETLQASR